MLLFIFLSLYIHLHLSLLLLLPSFHITPSLTLFPVTSIILFLLHLTHLLSSSPLFFPSPFSFCFNPSFSILCLNCSFCFSSISLYLSPPQFIPIPLFLTGFSIFLPFFLHHSISHIFPGFSSQSLLHLTLHFSVSPHFFPHPSPFAFLYLSSLLSIYISISLFFPSSILPLLSISHHLSCPFPFGQLILSHSSSLCLSQFLSITCSHFAPLYLSSILSIYISIFYLTPPFMPFPVCSAYSFSLFLSLPLPISFHHMFSFCFSLSFLHTLYIHLHLSFSQSSI